MRWDERLVPAGGYRGDLISFGVRMGTWLHSLGADWVSVEMEHPPAVG